MFWRVAGLALLLTAAACGGADRPDTARSPAAAPPAAGSSEIAAADSLRYFHEQLVTNGEDVQSDFGGALLALGMNPRDLQQDTAEHAYQTVLQKVREVPDPAVRREMMRTFFATAEAR